MGGSGYLDIANGEECAKLLGKFPSFNLHYGIQSKRTKQ